MAKGKKTKKPMGDYTALSLIVDEKNAEYATLLREHANKKKAFIEADERLKEIASKRQTALKNLQDKVQNLW